MAVATARLPEGSIDDMKLWPSPTSFDLRSGSPLYMARRATEFLNFSSASGSALRVMKFALTASLGQACQPILLSTTAPIGTSPVSTRTSVVASCGCCGPASTMTSAGGGVDMFLAT